MEPPALFWKEYGMTPTEIREFVEYAFNLIVRRVPLPREVAWISDVFQARGPMGVMHEVGALVDHGSIDTIHTYWKNGHYYSPVVNPDEYTRSYWRRQQELKPHEIAGVTLDVEAMRELWSVNADFLLANPFPEHADGSTRYFQENGSYPGGDAVFLGAIMRTYKPKCIIEVGSGNSTASMLDWADRLEMKDLQITCIEPDPVRLKNILRHETEVNIIPDIVQNVDLNLYKSLDRNDILFIDSTHVLKTGSDVHFELFQILPILREGVIIHFHDCAYPFEYPQEAVFDMNFSWNEAYAVRAFLMYNESFRVLLWNSLFFRFCSPETRAVFESLSRNPGGGLWLQKLR